MVQVTPSRPGRRAWPPAEKLRARAERIADLNIENQANQTREPSSPTLA
jgi:hypothetical protein